MAINVTKILLILVAFSSFLPCFSIIFQKKLIFPTSLFTAFNTNIYPCNPDSAQWAQKAHQVTTLAKVSIQHQCAVCSAVCTLYCPDGCAAPTMLQWALCTVTFRRAHRWRDYGEAEWRGWDHSFIADENQTPLFPHTISNVIGTNINLKSSAFWRISNLFLNDPYFLLAGVLTVSIDFQSTGFF